MAFAVLVKWRKTACCEIESLENRSLHSNSWRAILAPQRHALSPLENVVWAEGFISFWASNDEGMVILSFDMSNDVFCTYTCDSCLSRLHKSCSWVCFHGK